MVQSSRLRAGESCTDLENQNIQLQKGIDLMRLMRQLVVLKAPKRFRGILCRDCPFILIFTGSSLELSIAVSVMFLQ